VLGAVGWEVTEMALPEWGEATMAAGVLLVAEAWDTHRSLVERSRGQIGSDVVARLQFGSAVDDAAVTSSHGVRLRWQARLDDVFRHFDFLATPTLAIFPPPLGRGEELLMARCTLPVNLAGVPALSLPAPSSGAIPASLQLIGPAGSEEQLLAAGRDLEAAAT
jgi:Asp-tRNA(Asn)/Glu-tRNA(Gln) amidotransferase A subunit family amidase